MMISRELLFFFSALGAFNGVVIGLYFLLVAKPKTASNYFLGILLLALSIRIGKSVFLYFNDDLAGGLGRRVVSLNMQWQNIKTELVNFNFMPLKWKLIEK